MGRFFSLFSAVVLVAATVYGQQESATKPVGKTEKYYNLLLKRPRPGYLFDRFLNSWLEYSDLESLEIFLAQSEAPMTPALLAFYYEAVQELGKASSIYKKLIETHPDWEELLLFKANVDAERGFYIDAVDGLEKLLKLEPSNETELKALKLLGRSYLKMGREEKGLEAWEQLLEASGRDMDVAEELLDMQLAEGLYEEALENCERLSVEVRDPFRKVSLQMRRATILVRLDQRAEAIEVLGNAYGLTGQGSWLQKDVLSRIEQLYRGTDDLTGLCAFLGQMINENPGQPYLYRVYVDALLNNGKNEKALDEARQLLRMVPDNRDYREWYIQIITQQEQYEEALELMEQMLERYPKDNELRLQIAPLYALADQDEKVLDVLLSYLEHAKSEETAYMRVVRELTRYGFNNEATSILTDMISTWPESMDTREAVAMHLTREGQLALAWRHYEWLGERGDLELMLRLAGALKSIQQDERAYELLMGREEDFNKEYRFCLSVFHLAVALEKNEEAVAYGRMALNSAVEFRDLKMASASLVSELSAQKLVGQWTDDLKGRTNLDNGEISLLMRLLEKQKRVEEAIEFLDSALSEMPEDVFLLESRCDLSIKNRDWDTSEAILVQLIELQPKQKPAWIRKLIPVLVNAEKTEEALSWIEQLKKASPHAIRPYELERDILVAANRHQEAMDALRAAVRRNGESEGLKLALGALYETNGRLKEAEQLYWQMLNAEESVDKRLDRLSDIIRVNQKLGRLDLLVKELQTRAESSETAVFPLLGLAECHRISNRENERKAVLEELLELRPNDVYVLRAKARLEKEQGNYGAARDLMERIADIDTTGAAFRTMVEHEFLYGEHERAINWLEDPRATAKPKQFIELMKTLLSSGSVQGLREPLARIADDHRDDFRFAYIEALVHEESGRSSEAIDAFLSLLDVDAELPAKQKKEQMGMPYFQESPNENIFDRVVPDVLLRVNGNSIWRYGAYQYNPPPNIYGYNMPGSWMPENLDQLKTYTLFHLGNVMASLPEEEQQRYWGRVEAKVPYGRVLELPESREFGQAFNWEKAFELYPDGELEKYQCMLSPWSVDDEAAVRRVILELSDTGPDLAREVLYKAIRSHGDLADLLDKLEGPDWNSDEDYRDVILMLQRYLGNLKDDEEIHPAILKLAVKAREEGGGEERMPKGLEGAGELIPLAVGRDAAGLVLNLNKQYLEGEEFNRSIFPVSNYRRYYYGNQRRLNLDFPPTTMLDGKQHVIPMITAVPAMPKEKMIQAVKEVPDDPRFCLLALAELGEKRGNLQAYVDQLEDSNELDVESLMVLASWYRDMDVEKAVQYLMALHQHPDAAGQRQLIGSALLREAVMLDDPVTDELVQQLTPVVKEMVMLMHGNQQGLVLTFDAAVKLGIPEESLLSEKSNRRNAAKRRSQSGNQAYARSQAQYQQIQTLINESKTDQALQRMTSWLRSEAVKKIYPQGSRQGYHSSGFNHQLHNSINRFKRSSLQGELLMTFRPETHSTDGRRWFEYAYVCELLGMNKDAYDAYKRVSKLKPEWWGVEVRMTLLQAVEDLDASCTFVKTCSPRIASALARDLVQRIQQNQSSFDERLVLLKLLVEIPLNTIDASLTHNIFYAFQNDWYCNGQRLPGLFADSENGILAEDWEEPEKKDGNLAYLDDENLKEIQAERRTCYIEYARKSCVGSNASRGFETLLDYLTFVGAPVDADEIFTLSEQVLKRSGGHSVFYSFGGGRPGRTVGALEYYVTEMHRRGRFDEIEPLDDFGPSKELLTQMLALHRAQDETEYREAMAEAIKYSVHRQLKGMAAVLALHRLDERSYIIEDLLWNDIAEKCRSGRGYESIALVESMITHQPDAVEEHLQRFIELYFTDAERRLMATAKDGAIANNSYPMLYQKVHHLGALCVALPLDPSIFIAVYDQLAQLERSSQHCNNCDTIARRYASMKPSLKLFRQLGWTEDIAGFKIYRNKRGDDSVFNGLLMAAGNAAQGRDIADELKGKTGELTFGERLLLELLEAGSNADKIKAVLSLMAKHQDELSGAPGCIDELMVYIHNLEKSGSQVTENSFQEDASKAMFADYLQWKSDLQDREASELVNVPLATIMFNDWQWKDKWRFIMRKKIEECPEDAAEFYMNVNVRFDLAARIRGGAQDDRQNLQRVFQNSRYTESESEVVAEVVAALASDSADKWYEEQYLNQMFYRVRSTYQQKKMDYNEATVCAVQDMIAMTLNAAPDTALRCLKNPLQQLDKEKYGKLAEWMDGQDFPDHPACRIVAIYVGYDDEKDRAWLQDYLIDEEQELSQRLLSYEILSMRRTEKIDALKDVALMNTLLDRAEVDHSVKLPAALIMDAMTAIHIKPADDKQLRRVEQMVRFFRADRIAGGGSNRTMIFKLAEMAAECGLDDDARAFLSADAVSMYPQTYAMALRYGYDDLVTMKLKSKILVMKKQYSNSTTWIPAGAGERVDNIINDVGDEELRLVYKLFFAALSVKGDGKAEVNEEQISGLLYQANELLQRGETMRWVMLHFFSDKRTDELAELCCRYCAEEDVIALLERNVRSELNAYTGWISSVAGKGDAGTLGQLLDELYQRGNRESLLYGSRETVLNKLYESVLGMNNSELEEKAIELALKVEGLRNSRSRVTRATMMQKLGVMEFDSERMEWSKVPARKRSGVYKGFDDKMGERVRLQLDNRSEELQQQGMALADARHQARTELVDEWLSAAGKTGFLPLVKTICFDLATNACSSEERIRLVNYLHSLELDSLMLDQFKAVLALAEPKEYPANLLGQRGLAISTYLSRSDVDKVEKLRFINIASSQCGKISLLHNLSARKTILQMSSVKWVPNNNRYSTLLICGKPESDEEFKLYGTIVEPLISQLQKEAEKGKITPNSLSFADVAARALFAIGRKDDARDLLSKFCSDELNARLFMVAFEWGEYEWCMTQLNSGGGLEPLKRAKAFQEFDTEMLKFAKSQTALHRTALMLQGYPAEDVDKTAVEQWLEPWTKSFDLGGFVPVHRTIRHLQDQAGSDFKDIENEFLQQMAKACSASRTGEDVSRYLALPELDDAAIIDFVLCCKGQDLDQVIDVASRQNVFDVLERNPELAEEFSSEVNAILPVPTTAEVAREPVAGAM
jgi:tetratricopeptide (TPR) repeat protein